MKGFFENINTIESLIFSTSCDYDMSPNIVNQFYLEYNKTNLFYEKLNEYIKKRESYFNVKTKIDKPSFELLIDKYGLVKALEIFGNK